MATRNQATAPTTAVATPTPTALAVYEGDLAIAGMDLDVLKEVGEEAGEIKMTPLTLSKITVPSGDSIAFTVQMLDRPRAFEELEGVLIYAHKMRTYWGRTYDESLRDPEGGGPPRCQSWDGVTGVGDPGGDCQRCPLSDFGGECKPARGLYLLLLNEVLPRFVQVPQTSVTAADQYITTARMHPSDIRPLRSFLTKITLENRQKGLGKVLKFTRGANLRIDDAALVKRYVEAFRASLTMPVASAPRAALADPTAARRPSDPTQTTTENPLTEHDDDIPYGASTAEGGGVAEPF